MTFGKNMQSGETSSIIKIMKETANLKLTTQDHSTGATAILSNTFKMNEWLKLHF